jgi:hypothetical protein
VTVPVEDSRTLLLADAGLFPWTIRLDCFVAGTGTCSVSFTRTNAAEPNVFFPLASANFGQTVRYTAVLPTNDPGQRARVEITGRFSESTTCSFEGTVTLLPAVQLPLAGS